MKNYDINRNREPLSPEDIASGQDFQSFMNAYAARPKPFYKTTTFYLSAAALGILLGVGGYYLFNSNSPQEQTPVVAAPFGNLNPSDTTFVLDAAQGGVVNFVTGSQLSVPQGAFLDSAGNPVSGNVDLHYREFHDPASIFFAGIPMTYDSANTRFHFESAGMLEITAFQNGKPLKANPNAPIRIALVSNTDQDKFNLYYLDTVKRNWQFVQRDRAVIVAMEKDSTVKNDSSLVGSPIAPRKADRKKPSFSIAFDASEFPELAAYKGVRFEVDENRTAYNRADAKVEWEDVSVARNTDGQTFAVTFTKGDVQRTYITYAVVDDNNWSAAQRTFDARFKAWKEARDLRQAKADQDQKNREEELTNADEKRIFANRTALRRALNLRRAGATDEKESMVIREFAIKDFGVWNSDCPSSLPEGQQLFVKLIDSRNKKAIEVHQVFLVEKNRNAIFTYYAADLARFQFNPKAENVMWAVTSDGKLAVVKKEAFENIAPDAKNIELTMSVSDAPLANGAQALAMLGIQ